MTNTQTETQTRKASFISNELIAETVYDPSTGKASFAYFDGNELGYSESLEAQTQTIYPLDSRGDLLTRNVVLLPSEAKEYGTDQELLERINDFIHRHVQVSSEFQQIAAHYVLLTWVYDRLNELPYLRAIGDYGSGKSRFLQTVGSICYRPIITGGATTTAPIFRALDEIRGTLILDEADMKFSDKAADIIKILNMGYQAGGTVLRMKHKESAEVKAFNVFSPKIIGMREPFDDRALESRFLSETMGSDKLRSDIPLRLDKHFHEEARELRNQLLMWRFRNYRKELAFDDTPIQGLTPRLNQIIIPLMAVMGTPESKDTLTRFARARSAELLADRRQSKEFDIVMAILQFQYQTKRDKMTVGDVAKEVNARTSEDSDKMTARKVGYYLGSKLQLKTSKTRTGYALDLAQSQKRLDFWKDRFAITDEDICGAHVNVANVK